MNGLDAACATLACVAKLALPPACMHVAAVPLAPDHCASAHLSHGRGPAGEFLPDAEALFVMGAAAEVALRG